MHSNEPGSTWEPMVSAGYSREAELQELLQTGSSELVPADPSLDEQHVVYARELFTAAGPIDLVGIGSSGSVTIMECKLARNRQIKREVVGQVLDYAASLWQMDVASVAAAFRTSAGHDPFDALREKFEADGPAFDEEQCRVEVGRRLLDGDFRLLVAVDEIDADLRRIIQYVNRRGGLGRGLKLVALEFPRFEIGSVQVLVPESYGDELAVAPPTPGELTEIQRLHLEYWTGFQEYLHKRGTPIEFSKPQSASIASSRVGASGLTFRAWNLMNDGHSGVEAFPKSQEARARFVVVNRGLVDERLRRFGEVNWRFEPDPPVVSLSRDGKREGMPTDKQQWPKLMEWMAGALEELASLFGPTGQDNGAADDASRERDV